MLVYLCFDISINSQASVFVAGKAWRSCALLAHSQKLEPWSDPSAGLCELRNDSKGFQIFSKYIIMPQSVSTQRWNQLLKCRPGHFQSCYVQESKVWRDRSPFIKAYQTEIWSRSHCVRLVKSGKAPLHPRLKKSTFLLQHLSASPALVYETHAKLTAYTLVYYQAEETRSWRTQTI